LATFALFLAFVFRSFCFVEAKPDIPPKSRRPEEFLSPDGKWRSFIKAPNLFQEVATGDYYGQIQIDGEPALASLATSVWITASLRLADYPRTHGESRQGLIAPLFNKAAELTETQLGDNSSVKPHSKRNLASAMTNAKPLAYDINQAAFALNVCTKTIRRLLQRRKLTSCKALRKILIPREQIENFLKASCDKPDCQA
jgi:excisionase family DNA binding protein